MQLTTRQPLFAAWLLTGPAAALAVVATPRAAAAVDAERPRGSRYDDGDFLEVRAHAHKRPQVLDVQAHAVPQHELTDESSPPQEGRETRPKGGGVALLHKVNIHQWHGGRRAAREHRAPQPAAGA